MDNCGKYLTTGIMAASFFAPDVAKHTICVRDNPPRICEKVFNVTQDNDEDKIFSDNLNINYLGMRLEQVGTSNATGAMPGIEFENISRFADKQTKYWQIDT